MAWRSWPSAWSRWWPRSPRSTRATPAQKRASWRGRGSRHLPRGCRRWPWRSSPVWCSSCCSPAGAGASLGCAACSWWPRRASCCSSSMGSPTGGRRGRRRPTRWHRPARRGSRPSMPLASWHAWASWRRRSSPSHCSLTGGERSGGAATTRCRPGCWSGRWPRRSAAVPALWGGVAHALPASEVVAPLLLMATVPLLVVGAVVEMVRGAPSGAGRGLASAAGVDAARRRHRARVHRCGRRARPDGRWHRPDVVPRGRHRRHRRAARAGPPARPRPRRPARLRLP